MTKLIRGKVIVEKKLEADSTRPFASNDAPWVGAEQAWRNGIVPPPHEEASAYPEQSTTDDYRGLVLTESELETVLSSLPPPPAPETTSRLSWIYRILPFTGATGILVGTIWMAPQSRDASGDDPTPVNAAVLTAGTGRSACSAEKTETYLCDPEPEPVDEPGGETLSVPESGEEPMTAGGAVTVEEIAPEKTMEADAERRGAGIDSPTPIPSVVPAKGSRGVRRQTASRQVADRVSNRMSILALNTTVDAAQGNPNLPSKTNVKPAPGTEETGDLTKADSPNAREKETLAEAAIGSVGEVLHLAVTPREAANSTMEYQSGVGSPNAIPSATVIEAVKSSIAPVVERCNNGSSGRVVVALEVTGETGRVAAARLVEHGTAGINAGRCAARAVRLAKFPSFERRQYHLEYTFDL